MPVRTAWHPHAGGRHDGGWLINGRKTFISSAGTDMSFGVTLLARTEAAEGTPATSRASSSRRTRPASPWARSCGASAGGVSTPRAVLRRRLGRRRPPRRRSRDGARSVPPHARGRAHLDRGLVAQPDPSRARHGDGVRASSAAVRPAHLEVPGGAVQARRHRDQLEAALWLTIAPRSCATRAAVPQGSGDGEAEGQSPRGVGRVGSGADPRRRRLHARFTGRPLLLRCQGARDR